MAAAGFEDGVIRVWDINSGQLSYILKDTVEDVEQIMSAINNENSIKERVTCLQIITPNLHSYYNTSELLSEQKTPAILFATYRNGYFREWDLTSGQITHTICTNQKGGISCLFVVDDPDEIRIFTGARDGSVKCWVRTIYDLDNEFNIIDLDCDESRKNAWKLLYTLSGELGNAITSVDAKVVKTKNGCFGITVIGAADGEVRLYDYLTGQIITTLSYGTFNKQKIAKENKKQIFQQQQKRKIKDYSLEQDSSDEDYEFWDETEDFVSHQDAITSIIIHPLMEEVCPCGDTKETSGFSIITSSLDEKVNFWQLTRSFINCKCMASQLDDYDGEDASERPQKVSQWDNATIKYLGHVEQPGGSETVLLKGNIIGVRRVKNSKVHTKRSHGAEGEWEVWTLDISDLHMLELTEKIENSENHDDFVDFEVKTIPLVSEIDIIMEEQRKSKDKRQGRENVGRLKGFVGRRNAVSIANKNYNQNHLHDHNEEDYAQGQVVDFRNPSQKRRVYPDNSQNDRKLTSFKEDDEMNEMLPFSYIRRVVKVGEDGIAVT
ncbi:3546_t:CDS:1, partial [Scutellospora calospora]